MASFNQYTDDIVVCPFNENHKIARRRLIQHIMYCDSINAVKDVLKCPFNASHYVERHQLRQHLDSCPNKCHSDDSIGQFYEKLKNDKSRARSDESRALSDESPKANTIHDADDDDDWSNDNQPPFSIFGLYHKRDLENYYMLNPHMLKSHVKDTKNDETKQRKKKKHNHVHKDASKDVSKDALKVNDTLTQRENSFGGANDTKSDAILNEAFSTLKIAEKSIVKKEIKENAQFTKPNVTQIGWFQYKKNNYDISDDSEFPPL